MVETILVSVLGGMLWIVPAFLIYRLLRPRIGGALAELGQLPDAVRGALVDFKESFSSDGADDGGAPPRAELNELKRRFAKLEEDVLHWMQSGSQRLELAKRKERRLERAQEDDDEPNGGATQEQRELFERTLSGVRAEGQDDAGGDSLEAIRERMRRHG